LLGTLRTTTPVPPVEAARMIWSKQSSCHNSPQACP
jgi:hypothetical protein